MKAILASFQAISGSIQPNPSRSKITLEFSRMGHSTNKLFLSTEAENLI